MISFRRTEPARRTISTLIGHRLSVKTALLRGKASMASRRAPGLDNARTRLPCDRFAPRCRFRRSRPTVGSRPSHTFATSPPKPTAAPDRHCCQRSPTAPTAPSSSPIPTGGSSTSTRRLQECYTPASKQTGSETCWRNLDATSFRDLSTRALSPPAFGRWLLDHSAERAGAMLRRVGRSLARPPSPHDAQAGAGSHQAGVANTI